MSTSHISAILFFSGSGTSRSQRKINASGVMPMLRSAATECWVGLVLSSPEGPMKGTSEQCRKKQFSRPTSWRTCRAASRKGSDSMSPTVPPISVITTSGRCPSGSGVAIARMRALDLVGDMWNDLDGVTEILAAALFGDHRRIDLSRRDIRPAGQVAIEESLVVPDVEIGLGAVLGHEHLAVLERVHGPRVDVEVGVELLHRHLKAARRQQLTEAGCGETLPEGGNDAARYEEVLGGSLRVLA